MTYKLFIDDKRFPITDDWVIVRTSQEACEYVWRNGFPVEISFDHDLGGGDTSIVFLKWFMGLFIDFRSSLPEGFKYSIHSQNPIGAKSIGFYMQDIIRINDGNKH